MFIAFEFKEVKKFYGKMRYFVEYDQFYSARKQCENNFAISHK